MSKDTIAKSRATRRPTNKKRCKPEVPKWLRRGVDIPADAIYIIMEDRRFVHASGEEYHEIEEVGKLSAVEFAELREDLFLRRGYDKA